MSSSQPYEILIVDDIDDNRFTLDLMLSVLGDFSVDEAESGFEALDMMAEKTYDLVLLDIMMPGMTGLEVLQKLALASTESPTKVIVVSALQEIETIAQALELGALDYLPKPIEEVLLAARLRQLLERRDTDEALKQHRERIDADLKKAAEIQLSLCPKEPMMTSEDQSASRFEFVGTMRPAYEVGGDFYDYFSLPNGNVVLVVADACGKGAPAAIYATRVHDLLRLFARNQDQATMNDANASLVHMVTEVNAILSEDNDDCWFVTAWMAVLEPANGRVTWCSAGHCESLLQHADGGIEVLKIDAGLPLGLSEHFTSPVHEFTLSPSSMLHVYTDGITEHRLESGEFIGMDGLQAILSKTADSADLAQMVSATADAVQSINPSQSPEDDVTLLSLKCH